MGLTVRGLQSLKPGKWLTEPGKRNEGALRAKGGPDGARFYFRYRDPAGAYVDLPLGAFDVSGRTGLTLKGAQEIEGELRRRYKAGDHDLRGALKADQRLRQKEIEATESEAAAKAAADAATLGALCDAYADNLERQGKVSARSVRAALQRNIRDTLPRLWNTPAADITPDDGLDILEKLTDDGKLREAAKVRAYLRAAYAAAINARTKPDALPALRKLRIMANPIRDLGTVEGANRAKERALSVAELRAYWTAISALPDPSGALLRAHLLTGGQRCAQLARCTVASVDHDANALLLLDTKGRRSEARRHWVPLLPEVQADIARMRTTNAGDALFTLSCGAKPATHSSIGLKVREVAAAMIEAGTATEPFTVGDLRRTVETRLSALGVPLEVRAHLQSHGLGGVQARHYDRHDYMAEKRAALEQLHRLATGEPATVTPIKKATKSGTRR